MNKKFWMDTLERTVYTMAETALGLMGASTMFSEVNWKMALSATLFSGLVTVLKCIVVRKEVK